MYRNSIILIPLISSGTAGFEPTSTVLKTAILTPELSTYICRRDTKESNLGYEGFAVLGQNHPIGASLGRINSQ